ncbi:(Na+)-NQR maturation NqrM [Rhodobacteraceae bacterium RKSG542]|uniref:(Na+)-NQR maturation NqrM n=1 Tax=Pseudovibrio flavus TaxID=2529854 RepID=UPI0012BC721A|nr:(Na+)-NQR maturation NqrM [Pseudovibrio flavus]MTI16046.1 (Na+)-NQR maturation NqrM [Pseudovibrio flavus]
MTTFVIAFFALILVVAGMAIGAVFRNKPITGSCGGLNAIEGSDRCVVCKREVDPNSPLAEQLRPCKRRQQQQDAA